MSTIEQNDWKESFKIAKHRDGQIVITHRFSNRQFHVPHVMDGVPDDSLKDLFAFFANDIWKTAFSEGERYAKSKIRDALGL